jgi:hypothetical protein
MATDNANATVAFARRRARHGKGPIAIRRATWDFASQNVAKSGVANFLTIPGNTYVLGGKLTITSALTASTTLTIKLGSVAITGAVAKSAATTVLGVAATADMAPYTASAAAITATNASAAAIVAGKATLEVITVELDKL